MTSSDAERISRPTEGQTDREIHTKRETQRHNTHRETMIQ